MIFAALYAKYREGVKLMLKAENDALRDDVPLVVVGCCQSSLSESVREATTASGVDNATSPTGRHRPDGYFTLRG